MHRRTSALIEPFYAIVLMIELKNISKTYVESNGRKTGIFDVSLSFPSTGLIWIKGRSGAGKSTLLSVLSLQKEKDGGTIIIDGKDSFTPKEIFLYRRDYFAFVSQEFDLLNEFTVKDNLLFAKSLCGEKDESLIESVFKKVGLPLEYLDKKPFELSGGERQRVAIARALLKTPRVLICDEPTGNLDLENAKSVIRVLKEASKNILVLVASHDEELLQEYSDGFVTLTAGKIESSSLNGDKEVISFSPREAKEPFRLKGKLAFAFSKKGMLRYIVTSLGLLISLSGAFLGISISHYDKVEVCNTYFSNSHVHYFEISKSDGERGIPLSSYEKDLAISMFGERNVAYTGTFIPYVRDVETHSWPSSDRIAIDEFKSSWLGDLYGRVPLDTQADEVVVTVHSCYKNGWIDSEKIDEKTATEIMERKSLQLKGDSFEKPLKIVGVLDTHFEKKDEKEYVGVFNNRVELSENHDYDYFSEESFRYLTENYPSREQKGNYIVFVHGTNGAFTREEEFQEKVQGAKIRFSSRFEDTLFRLESFVSLWGPVLMVLSYFLLALGFVSLLGLLKSLIERTKDDFRILQMLGLSKKGVFDILLFESEGVCLPCLALSFGIACLAINQLNVYLMNRLFLLIGPFTYFHLEYLYELVLPTLLVGAILAFVFALVYSCRSIKGKRDETNS